MNDLVKKLKTSDYVWVKDSPGVITNVDGVKVRIYLENWWRLFHGTVQTYYLITDEMELEFKEGTEEFTALSEIYSRGKQPGEIKLLEKLK